jgi:hypothetical protein
MGTISANNITPSSFHCPDWSSSSDFSTLVPSTSSVLSSRGDFGQSNHADPLYNQHSAHSSGTSRNDFFDSSQPTMHQQTGKRQSLSQYRVDDRVNFDNANIEFRHQRDLPFQREENEGGQGAVHMGNGSTNITSMPSPMSIRDSNGTTGNFKVSEETGVAILDPLVNFLSLISRSQNETIGMATVVAEYVGWMRNVPASGAPLISNTTYKGMLETIESRIRELGEVAQAREQGPVRELVAALETIAPPGGTMATRLSDLEQELSKQTVNVSQFFQKSYDPCASLSGQSRTTI